MIYFVFRAESSVDASISALKGEAVGATEADWRTVTRFFTGAGINAVLVRFPSTELLKGALLAGGVEAFAVTDALEASELSADASIFVIDETGAPLGGIDYPELGFALGPDLAVTFVEPGGPADPILAVGDTILRVGSQAVASPAEFDAALAAASAAGLSVVLLQARSTSGIQRFVALDISELPLGTEGDDLFEGTPENDTVDGLAGNDAISGLAGADTLVGGLGNDTLDGGANPEGMSGQGDVMLGGDGDDTYHVDSGLDLVDEGAYFPDFGFGGTDTIISTADFYWDIASVGEKLIVSEAVNDAGGDGVTVVGGIFNNTITGHSGIDIMFGRGGSDTYRGGDGVNWYSLSLLGLTYTNAYLAVDGPNTVIVDQRETGPFSYHIIFEFETGKDKVNVSNFAAANGLATGADVLGRGVDDGTGNSYYALGDGLDYLYMVGLEKADLTAGDFVV